MSKYSYSLDVGKDLDAELSVPKGLEKYEKEFKELVEDDKPDAEPRNEAPKKEEKREAPKKEEKKDERRDEKKEVKKEEKREAPKKEEKKEERRDEKKEPRKEEKRETPKRDEKKEIKKPVKDVKSIKQVRSEPSRPKQKEVRVERPKPKLEPVPVVKPATTFVPPQQPPQQQGVPPGRLPLAILISVIIIAALFYFFQTISAVDVPAAETCTAEYVQGKQGVMLNWDKMSAVERRWMKEAFLTAESARSAEIMHMLACKDAKITEQSDPAVYVSCSTPPIYVTVTPGTLTALEKEARRNSIVVGLSNPKSEFKRFFSIAYATEDPKLVTWRVKY